MQELYLALCMRLTILCFSKGLLWRPDRMATCAATSSCRWHRAGPADHAAQGQHRVGGSLLACHLVWVATCLHMTSFAFTSGYWAVCQGKPRRCTLVLLSQLSHTSLCTAAV